MSDFKQNRYLNAEWVGKRMAMGLHREGIGGMWDEIGEVQFDFLRNQGLRPEHSLLDVGCGTFRLGVKAIPYLAPAHYFGVELRPEHVEAGFERELGPAGLLDRIPRENIAVNPDFDVSAFGQRFDFAIANSVFTHVPWNDVRLCLEQLIGAMKPGGKFFASYFPLAEGALSKTPIKQRSGAVTRANQDPYHYKVSDLANACRGLPFELEIIGAWGHPRHIDMAAFTRLPDQAGLA